MNTLYQQLGGESLNAALLRLEGEIKTRPADADLRAAFVQFLALDGNWSRALTQLKSWLALKPQAKPTVTLLEQAIAGEQQREQVLAGKARPSMPDAQWPWLATLASALAETGERAQALRLQALEEAEANPGQLTFENEKTQPFAWLMDGDARLGPVCEAIVNGRYVWLPFSAIEEIRFQAPASVTDLVWRHALVRLTDGAEQVCQIPARYPFAPEAGDHIKLGRATEWLPLDNDETLYQGLGQKTWLDEQNESPLLSLSLVTFTAGDAHE
ncbi:type VI secretion system accessory protein TagJ [Franconibacter pulveris 1160]|jgi:type VI secretion system protein ImpE|uniref:Protein of avirulence locus ImpE n=2 Tax=Franconibacter pulveris TaxID=435910 RepID=A0A0J8Y612_9ENTR|nr:MULTISPECIES: type VI secretion system accessory protein TagJ [Franconibacter]KMV32859.1 protein of avirulence locus ImpE [Franconibacter pulveris]MCK1968486.1 protein of avirulence locus ImpE [Franconibacter sp. IITDAS19]GGD20091.1 type VI secretion system protein ImpE [Franconibacter daqui]